MFKKAVSYITTTRNGAFSYKKTTSNRVNLFYKTCRGIDNKELYELLDESWSEDKLDTLKLIAYTRDIRGGKGEREIFRKMLEWLSKKDPEVLKNNLKQLLEFCRYDDIFVLFNTQLEEFCVDLLVDTIKKDNVSKDSVTLLAKWLPSENNSTDKKYKITKKICEKMKITPRIFRKKYLTPLRKKIDIIETKLCQKLYSDIDFSKIPSYAMKKYKKLFEKSIQEEFTLYKSKLSKGETKINSDILFPHEIVKQYMDNKEVDIIFEEQWKNISQKTNKLKDCLVLSDVSGSMEGTPMYVSIALGILISSNTSENFRDLVLTFETNPRFHNIKADTLLKKIQILSKAPWGGSTNFYRAMLKILEVSVQNNIKQEDMPKKLIVISDMQFDMADRSYYSNYQSLVNLYKTKGYDVPGVVFWNVNGCSKDSPVNDQNEQNVSLVSGFSKDILNCILEGNDFSPYSTMRTAIDNPRYSCLHI